MFPEETVAPSKKAQRLSEYVKLYCLVFVLLSVAKCFVLGPHVLISDLIAALVLFFGCMSFDYCYITVFLLFTIFSAVMYIASIGQMIQRRVSFRDKRTILALVAMGVSILIYIIGWWITFLAYKEFKACALGYARPELWTDPEEERIRADDEAPGEAQVRHDRPFTAFQGRGVAVG